MRFPRTIPDMAGGYYNPTTCTPNNSCFTQAITEANMGGNGFYNSLQASVEQRLRNGLTLLGNYTWSNAIDNTPYNQSSTAIASGQLVRPSHL